GNELREHDDVLEPQFGLDLRTDGLANLGVRERPQDLLGDLGRQNNFDCSIANKPLNDLSWRAFRADVRTNVHICINNGSKHRSLRLRSRLALLATSPALRL